MTQPIDLDALQALEATPREIEFARLAADHYGRPESDVPALIAFERHRNEQVKIPGMPGLCGAVPNFIAGFNTGSAALIARLRKAEAEAAPMIDALKFYAEGCHFHLHDPSAWDTVSGEPANFYEDEACTATVEDGSIAKMALDRIAAPSDSGREG